MTSLALYLKWRPQRFEDVVGQEHVTHTLINAMRGGRIAHAYLFTGPRGTGKTTMARLLAKAVNCLDDDVANRPCNRCHICQSINEGRLLDLIEMDAASHTGVDNVREAIRDKVGFRPSEARYKVYVIDEVHMLSTSAFNALLKTLEEPPEHVIFVLATTEPHRLLPTIVSRCQRFDFRRIPLSALVARLRYVADEEGIQITEDALQFIARTATGSARDAISLMDQLTAYGEEEITVDRLRSVLGYSDSEIVHQVVAHLCAHEIGPGLTVIQQAVGQGVEMRQFAQQVVDYVRAVLLDRVGGDQSANVLAIDADEGTWTRIHELAELFSVHDLLRAIKVFNQAQLDLRNSDQGQLALELAFVEAALAEEQPGTVPVVEQAGTVGASALPATVSRATQPREQARRATSKRNVGGVSPPPAAPSRASSSGPNAETMVQEESGQRELNTASIAPEYIQRMQTEISTALRAEGTLGRNADGLFRSVFVIGGIRVLPGNEILLGLPPNVLKRVTGDVCQVVEQVIGSVLARPCSVRFVAKSALREQRAEGPPGGGEVASAETPGGAVDAVAMGDREIVEADAEGMRSDARESSSQQTAQRDPYQEAVSDPVVQDLISRGGQVTDVQVLSEDE